MMRLSIEGERRLKTTVYETLENQLKQLITAYERNESHKIRQIGHSLRGNSGAAYFNLTDVEEIGKRLYHMTDMEPLAFQSIISKLSSIIVQLDQELSNSGT